MENEEILTKAVEKAIANGMEDDIPHSMFSLEFATWNWHNTIFSHNFAKAFWGEAVEHKWLGDVCCKCGLNYAEWLGSLCEEPWQYHLQTMVLEEDPIKYLEKFLDQSN